MECLFNIDKNVDVFFIDQVSSSSLQVSKWITDFSWRILKNLKLHRFESMPTRMVWYSRFNRHFRDCFCSSPLTSPTSINFDCCVDYFRNILALKSTWISLRHFVGEPGCYQARLKVKCLTKRNKIVLSRITAALQYKQRWSTELVYPQKASKAENTKSYFTNFLVVFFGRRILVVFQNRKSY